MKANEMLNKIKNIVGIELTEEVVKLAEMILENGTVILAESFEAGQAVFIKTEEDTEQVALPVGEYGLEDGRVLLVAEEGIIQGIKTNEDMKNENLAEDDEKEADVADWAGMEKRIENLEIAVAKLKEEKQPRGEEEVEASKEEVKEELSSDVTTLEDVETIKHNPETKENKKGDVLFSQKRQTTTRDRVFSKIANY